MVEAATPSAMRKGASLAVRASLFMAGVLALFAVCCALAFFILQLNTAKDRITNSSRNIAHYFAQNAGRISGSPESLAASADQTVEWPNVRRVVLYDDGGRVLLARGESAGPLEAEALRRVRAGAPESSAQTGAMAVVARPVMHEGRLVGYAVLTLRNERVFTQVWMAMAAFAIVVAAYLVLAVGVTLAFVRRTVRPLAELTGFAEKVSAHGRGEFIAIRTGDEFETLAAAFNRMITRLDDSMRQVHRLAYTDAETGLPNAERFAKELASYGARADEEGSVGAVFIVDFSRVSRILETLGEEAARDLMMKLGDRFKAAVRTVDKHVRIQSYQEKPTFTARLRQHELAVIVPGFSASASVLRYAQMLASALNQPFEWRDLKLTVDVRCGGAVIGQDGRDADTLTRNARLALNAARTTQGASRMFSSALDRDMIDRITLEHELRAAIERNEFHAFFQPKVNLADGRIEGAEALARWIRPDRTIVSPGVFIPLAEEAGLIGQVADAIMREACWKAAAWAREGLPVQVAVNVSALQFRDEAFPEHVLKILDQAGLPAFCLELELTESIAMENPEQALRMIEPLRARGVRFSIDDFGCGHSSLAALTRLPFDVLKIDQQFVRGLEKDRYAPAIIETILAMAATLDMQVVAEGIEQEREAQFLRRRGCLIGQGFLYGAAEPASAFAERLRAQHGQHAAVDQLRGTHDAA